MFGMSFAGRTALVTGGTTGIGRGIALELARRGARVAVNYRRDGPSVQETIAALSDLGQPCLAVAADIRFADQVRRMVEQVAAELGPIDVLVNNAGIGTWGSVVDYPEEEWDATFDTNVKGAFLCIKAVAPGMMERRWGRIVNVSSTSSIRVIGGMTAYCASKAGLAMLTKGVAVDLGRFGITANAVGPSTVPTRINAADLAQPGFLQAEQDANPSGRIGTVDDIAAAVAFLASEEASWINGQNLIVDGGLTTLSPQPSYGQ
jgi:NAD(P)-dependent dehydrogenase (short-subunit alcohol dehydrogenase family)